MVWFTADTHFFHANIIKYCNRPFAITEEMDRAMADNWKALVKPGDTVYHLGDFAFGKPWVAADLLKRLPGKKILVKGNHDKGVNRLVGPGMFEEVHDRLTLEVGGRKVLLCHYPYYPNAQELAEAQANGYDLRYLERRPKDQGAVLLCGHVHEKWLWRGRSLNLGVDQWGFKPVSEEQVVAAILERQGESE